ncbi:M23 family metallopeptidase [Rapidithrix thailandica]|uniref:M23 family metallopeptidase n=1 Tax=Rapidithrix thailandica TaxID=413964 RepID=A0AAW9RSZ4_9BACT
MAKIKYYYDTETCRYERIKTSTTDIVINALGLMFLCITFGFIFSLIYSEYFPSSKEVQLIKENEDLLYSYDLLQKEIENTNDMLANLQDRDENIYRVIFEMDPIPMEIRNAGSGGSQKFQDLLDKKLSREKLIHGTLKKVDQLRRKMYIQTKSYDDLVEMAKNKNKLLAAMPAIQPIANKDLKRFASGFGYRLHPILKVKKMHTGCDFSAPKGTPIYATGDGVVITVEFNRGYGKQVEIDHGFGYITKYAHMNEFNVKKGQKVSRGQVIGKVGSTGLSVAPHLHYEVIHKGKKKNPVHYFYNDLSPEQFEILVEMASRENSSLGY